MISESVTKQACFCGSSLFRCRYSELQLHCFQAQIETPVKIKAIGHSKWPMALKTFPWPTNSFGVKYFFKDPISNLRHLARHPHGPPPPPKNNNHNTFLKKKDTEENVRENKLVSTHYLKKKAVHTANISYRECAIPWTEFQVNF